MTDKALKKASIKLDMTINVKTKQDELLHYWTGFWPESVQIGKDKRDYVRGYLVFANTSDRQDYWSYMSYAELVLDYPEIVDRILAKAELWWSKANKDYVARQKQSFMVCGCSWHVTDKGHVEKPCLFESNIPRLGRGECPSTITIDTVKLGSMDQKTIDTVSNLVYHEMIVLNTICKWVWECTETAKDGFTAPSTTVTQALIRQARRAIRHPRTAQSKKPKHDKPTVSVDGALVSVTVPVSAAIPTAVSSDPISETSTSDKAALTEADWQVNTGMPMFDDPIPTSSNSSVTGSAKTSQDSVGTDQVQSNSVQEDSKHESKRSGGLEALESIRDKTQPTAPILTLDNDSDFSLALAKFETKLRQGLSNKSSKIDSAFQQLLVSMDKIETVKEDDGLRQPSEILMEMRTSDTSDQEAEGDSTVSKRCSKCNKIKSIDLFNSGTGPYGKHVWCRSCCSVRHREPPLNKSSRKRKSPAPETSEDDSTLETEKEDDDDSSASANKSNATSTDAETKTCTRCKKAKPTTEFHRRLDGHQFWCKVCDNNRSLPARKVVQSKSSTSKSMAKDDSPAVSKRTVTDTESPRDAVSTRTCIGCKETKDYSHYVPIGVGYSKKCNECRSKIPSRKSTLDVPAKSKKKTLPEPLSNLPNASHKSDSSNTANNSMEKETLDLINALNDYRHEPYTRTVWQGPVDTFLDESESKQTVGSSSPSLGSIVAIPFSGTNPRSCLFS